MDVVGPRRDGWMVPAAGGRLWLLGPSPAVRALPPAYHSNPGLEAYIALARASHKGCSFGADHLVRRELRLPSRRHFRQRSWAGARFASITAPGPINGIAFDETGRFGYRLLVTINARTRTTVHFDCHGSIRGLGMETRPVLSQAQTQTRWSVRSLTSNDHNRSWALPPAPGHENGKLTLVLAVRRARSSRR
jgi:hypothetical protein